MTYSPFDKELNDIDESELNKLIDNSISEGWYIEFKSDFPKKASKFDSSKIVKSISAFANTKGGWLFYGIEANDKNIATNLCGIDLNDYNNLSDQISQIIASNIDPRPTYHFKIVTLKSGRSVFVIKIEESPIPPYITSQGIIYQRENNESNPIKDRYIIEKLTEKTNDYYENIERFCSIDYGETKGQTDSNQSYLELYFFPLPYNEFKFKNFFSTDFFRQVAARFYENVDCSFKNEIDENISLQLSLGFNSIYSSHNSLIIRPLKDENIIYKTTTAELFINGGLKFLIPLYEFDINQVPSFYKESEVIKYLQEKYSPYETVEKYFQYLPKMSEREPTMVTKRKQTDFVNHIRMIDGVELIYDLMIILSIYKLVLNDNDFDPTIEIGFRAKLTDTWRKFIFFDNSDFLEKIKLFNLPISPKNDVEVPKFIKGNFYNLDLSSHDTFETVMMSILDAIGLPDSSTIKFTDIINDGIKRFNTND